MRTRTRCPPALVRRLLQSVESAGPEGGAGNGGASQTVAHESPGTAADLSTANTAVIGFPLRSSWSSFLASQVSEPLLVDQYSSASFSIFSSRV